MIRDLVTQVSTHIHERTNTTYRILSGTIAFREYPKTVLQKEGIVHFRERGAPVDGFGIGSYISGTRPIDFTADLHEVEGRPIAKRGRTPGITPNPRLKRVL